jgi:hypothetical protein
MLDFNFTIEPSLDKVKEFLAEALTKDLAELKPDEVVVLKGTRRSWKHRYDDNTLVKIVTANDAAVCKFCLDMASHNPYRFADAKKQLPHHPNCRCQIRSLRATDSGYFRQPTLGKFVRYAKVRLKAYKQKGKPVPQRGATIKKLRSKKRRFVAPSGYRAIKIRTSRGS